MAATEATAAKPKKPKNCREEAPLDSYIKRTRCISDEQAEKDQQTAERVIRGNDAANSGINRR